MKFGKTSASGASIALLVIQLTIVSSIAGKYLYERWTCPRVWTRSMVYDPELLMRGRYASLQLLVDGCRSTLPSAELAAMPRDRNGVQTGTKYTIRGEQVVQFAARLKVEGNKLVAIRLPEFERQQGAQMVSASPGSSCADLRLETPVDFYIPEHAANPAPIRAAQELWVEVTVPPKGPPRPTQLALKENGVWKPLGLE
jgi:hypothetical protein